MVAKKNLLRRADGLVLATGLALAPVPAAAEDYPYSGLFWPSLPGFDLANVDRPCALTFLDQAKDGSWAVYHVDLESFRKDGTVQYHKLAAGSCVYAPETKVESCKVTMDKSYPDGEGDVVLDVVTEIQSDRVTTVMIENPDDWKLVAEAGDSIPQEPQLVFLRCPYPDSVIKTLISADVTTLSAENLNALRYPSEELLSSDDVSRLVETLNGN